MALRKCKHRKCFKKRECRIMLRHSLKLCIYLHPVDAGEENLSARQYLLPGRRWPSVARSDEECGQKSVGFCLVIIPRTASNLSPFLTRHGLRRDTLPPGEGIYRRGCYQPFYLWIYILVISGSPSPWTMQRNSQPYRS